MSKKGISRRDFLKAGGGDAIMFSNEASLPYLTQVEPVVSARKGWVSAFAQAARRG